MTCKPRRHGTKRRLIELQAQPREDLNAAKPAPLLAAGVRPAPPLLPPFLPLSTPHHRHSQLRAPSSIRSRRATSCLAAVRATKAHLNTRALSTQRRHHLPKVVTRRVNVVGICVLGQVRALLLAKEICSVLAYNKSAASPKRSSLERRPNH